MKRYFLIFAFLFYAGISFAQDNRYGSFNAATFDATITTIDSANITDGGITTADIRTAAITAAKIVADAVGASELAANAVDSTNIIDGSISKNDLRVSIIDSSRITNGGINTDDIRTAAINADKIVADAVGQSELAESMNFVPTGAWDFGGANGLELPNGVNPTVDADGEIAVDTDEPALRFQANSIDYSLPGLQSARFVIPNPTTADDYPLGSWPANFTIVQIRVLCIGGTSVVGGLDETDANGANAVAVDADITASAGTTATDDGSLTNATIDADDQLTWHTTTVNGSPTSVTVTIYFRYDLVN